MNKQTYSYKGKQQSPFCIELDMWQEFIGSRTDKPEDFIQRLEMLRESVRRCMRAEYESYLNDKATMGRVTETKGQAILLGKIIAEFKRERQSYHPLCAACLSCGHSECIGQGCYCDCQVPA